MEHDLLQAKDIGETAYKAFREKWPQSNPPKVKCHDTITKAKLKTLNYLNKKTSVKAGQNQEVILRTDRRFFAQMIVIAESRNLQMREVLSHPLGPLPWSLLPQTAWSVRQTKHPWQKNSRKMSMLQIPFPNPRRVKLMRWLLFSVWEVISRHLLLLLKLCFAEFLMKVDPVTGSMSYLMITEMNP